MATRTKDGLSLTDDDKFIAAIFNNGEENFDLALNNVGGMQVMNLIGHLAIMLETREGISIEETAAKLVASQAGFEQMIKPPEKHGE